MYSAKRQRRTPFDDPFFHEFFNKIRLPVVDFKKDPQDLFFYLKDLAQDYVGLIQKNQGNKGLHDKLQYEFYVVCMLNALFGNPNIHLVHLHPKFHSGYNNFQNAMRRYGQRSNESRTNFVDCDDFAVGKKRRNAVAEVIRFICQQEFSSQYDCPLVNASQDQIYHSTL